MSCFCPLNSVWAQVGDMGESLENVGENVASTDKLFNIFCYLLALGFGIAGVRKIKEFSEAPGKVGIRDPLMKLLAAGFFVSLPALITIIINSTVGDGGEIDLMVSIPN